MRRFLTHTHWSAFIKVMMPQTRFVSFLLLFAALVLSTPGASAQATFTSEARATFTLTNGLEVVVLQHPRTPVVTRLILKDENVLPERDVVLEEYNMRVANNPDALLNEQIMAALYLNHPYGRPVIGWHQEIEKLDREDALAFYKRFYAPNNAILVIAGDTDAKEVRPLVEQTFGKI